MSLRIKISLLLLFTIQLLFAQEKQMTLSGKVLNIADGKPIQGAALKFGNAYFSASSDANGFFSIQLPSKEVIHITCVHLGYETLYREIKSKGMDSVNITLQMKADITILPEVPVSAERKPETLVGKPNYGIYDFDFYEDKLILLTSEGSLKKAQLRVADYNGKIYSTYQLPQDAGEAQNFYHDYEGYTELVCSDTVFRLEVLGTDLLLMTVRKHEFERYIKPVADTANGNLYYSTHWDKFPSFNYYYFRHNDTVNHLLNKISNDDLLKMYNMEYYFLPSRMQLEARRMADFYKTDVHIVAALMSGFTQSMFYEPLYAPLFVLNDTICIFNHHNDYLYHYNKDNKLLDSVKINYHHPKNWREWKKKLFVDEAQNKVYAFFSKDEHHYLKQIDFRTGQAVLTYKLKNHSAEKIKIKDGYVYYVYRPFGSMQERYLYRERIE